MGLTVIHGIFAILHIALLIIVIPKITNTKEKWSLFSLNVILAIINGVIVLRFINI